MDHLSTVCFCVNTELEAKLGMKITSYADLLDPRLKGKIVLSNPNSSSAAWNNLCNIFSVFGYDTPEAWNYMEKLMANLIVVKSSSVCFNSVHDGEYVVGLTYEDGAVKLLQNGAKNIRVQYPDEGTSAAAYGVAVIKNAPHMAAAKAFADFICSAEGQTAVAKYMEGTLRLTNRNYKIPSGAWLKASSDIKWVNRPVKKVTDGKTAMLDKWNTLWARISK